MFVRRNKRQVPGVNTASTADISFMLLIFFLVTTSMDVDKGLFRLLPSPEPQKQLKTETIVDKNTLMALHVTADHRLLLNDKPIEVSRLKGEIIQFVNRLGNRHLISIESDREAQDGCLGLYLAAHGACGGCLAGGSSTVAQNGV